MTTHTIKFKRGVKSKLNNLSYGEPAYISDEGELYRYRKWSRKTN